LDKFKQVNDSLGHDVGDLLLKQVAKRLTTTLRLTDTVARLGGDEFVVLLESYKDDNNVSHVARKMLKAIGEPMQLGNHTVSVSPSIGIAMYPEDAADARELLKHADVAMYYAKDSGRNNFQFFIEDMNQKAHMQLARETRIRSAWQRDEFMNYYQPIYDSRSNQMIGVEVLMRWLDEDMLVPPAEFIPLAEDLRLIVPMTQALLVRALTDLQQWHQAGFAVYVSVNLSPRHLEQEQLAIETAALLDKFHIPAQCLRFEVTESALMQDHQSAIATMLALSELGVQLALDDFGTGYSSLKYLKELPIDAIKIDRSFVKDIGIDRNDETIIEAMLSMANSLGMYCIAEGVETQQQLEFFTERQCYFIQGYLLGKPMTAEHLLNKMQLERPTA
jgi:diguanylate cyclase (GGDEF)-like protein